MDETEQSRATAPPGVPMFKLPPPDTKRWVPGRKAIVVAAVHLGVLSL